MKLSGCKVDPLIKSNIHIIRYDHLTRILPPLLLSLLTTITNTSPTTVALVGTSIIVIVIVMAIVEVTRSALELGQLLHRFLEAVVEVAHQLLLMGHEQV